MRRTGGDIKTTYFFYYLSRTGQGIGPDRFQPNSDTITQNTVFVCMNVYVCVSKMNHFTETSVNETITDIIFDFQTVLSACQ